MEVMLKYPQFEATTMLKEGMVRNGLRSPIGTCDRSLREPRCVRIVGLSTTLARVSACPHNIDASKVLVSIGSGGVLATHPTACHFVSGIGVGSPIGALRCIRTLGLSGLRAPEL